MSSRINNNEKLSHDDWIVYCEECDQTWKVSDADTLFRWEHRKHTGHLPDGPVAACQFYENVWGKRWTLS